MTWRSPSVVFDRYQGYNIADQLVIIDLAHLQGSCVSDQVCDVSAVSLTCSVDYVQVMWIRCT
jgi:hypothetical protein